MDNVIRMFEEEFENEQTGERVTGVTVMVDGKLKQMLDAIMNKTGKYEKYTEVVRDMLFAGINDFVSKNRP